MGYNEFMAKIRHWDNQSAKWMMRHFYFLFFQVFLILIFLIFFVNVLRVIDIGPGVAHNSVIEQLLLSQTINGLVIVILLLLNSFWTLFIFSSIIRLSSTLREISFNTSKFKNVK